MCQLIKFSLLVILLSAFTSSSAHFSGPYLIWGGENLNSLKQAALEGKILIKFSSKNNF